ncbi:Glycosyl transferase family 8 [Rhizobium sp. NFR07]|uniref:glycosyltransferase n=1 Tax=Rhizobium sp. NFR07 TaxID=1566262 RepID=UPI0008F16FD2|nr:glycosyltransferase [Rhizobium sp. NFR07]SFB52097.1 Glycosyl transferase family 8 [Rhizobium sp. NFR07]
MQNGLNGMQRTELSEVSAHKGAVIFLMDRSYLLPFKVMMHSLRDAIENRQEDLVVLTDDATLVADPFLNRICDKIIKIEDSQLKLLRSIDLSSVPDEFRHPKYGVYWFLKFLVFDNYGYDYHLYFDTDMLCLNRFFNFRDIYAPEQRFSASPTIGKSALGIPKSSRGEAHDDAERSRIVETTKLIASRNYRSNRSINSGVMSIPKRLIGADSVTSLVRLATEKSFRLEQEVVRTWVAELDPELFTCLPIWYNMPELPLRASGYTNSIERLLPYSSILHFNLHPKPWKGVRQEDWVHRIWHDHRQLADNWIERMSEAPKFAERLATRYKIAKRVVSSRGTLSSGSE